MNIQTPKVTFEQILKSPPVYMLMVAVAMLSFFVYKYGVANDERNDACDARVERLERENARIQMEKDVLTTSLLIKNGVIQQQAQDKKELDSALQDLAPKARNIVKEQ
jgi:hypothetical protein